MNQHDRRRIVQTLLRAGVRPNTPEWAAWRALLASKA